MNELATWERPKTIKRYLHPPKSERLFTLWAEGKIVLGEVNVKDYNVGSGYKAGRSYYFGLESCFVWMLHGENAEQFDFRKVKNSITDDGTPIHGVAYDLGDREVKLEGFCNTERKSTCFAKITVSNNSDAAIADQLVLMLRSGKESELVFGTPNGYVRHDPDVNIQKQLSATWRCENGCYTDGMRVLRIQDAAQAKWDEKTGMIAIPYALEKGEKAEIIFCLDMGEVETFDFDAQKAAWQAFWSRELGKITKLPASLAQDAEKVRMIRHLTALMLQTFSYPIGEEYLLSRQGGMMSIVWPSEAMYTIEALSRLGDFGAYIQPALETYFDVMQLPSGEVMNVGAYWSSVTAACIYSFSRYCAECGGDFYEKYRDKVFAACRWISQKRRGVEDSGNVAGGLFPPALSNDWADQFQGWTLTDVFNLFAMEALAQTATGYGDPEAQWVAEEHRAYLADMKRHFKKYHDADEGRDTLKIPLKPMGDDRDLIDNLFPLLYHGRFIWCGVIDDENDIRRVYKYMLDHDIARHGFYGHMPYEHGNEHVWYMSVTDYYWHKIWLRLGEKEKAAEIIDYELRFAMSDEYNMQERYEDNSPYYAPWSPNASANGRLIMMLLDSAQ